MAAIFERFPSIRNNGELTPLWLPYTGVSTIQFQQGSLDNNSYHVSAYGGSAVYFQFLPRGVDAYLTSGWAQNFTTSGTWDVNFNRLTFIVKTDSSVSANSNGADNTQIGTYCRPHSAWSSPNMLSDHDFQGDHYYHHINMNHYPNRWFKVWMNPTPTHKVGMDSNLNPGNDPEFSLSGVHYMDGLTRLYYDTDANNAGKFANSNFWFDNFTFDRSFNNEPDFEISTIVAIYTGTCYEISWNAPRNRSISYFVKYNTSSMHNIGFSLGTSGGTVASTGNAYTGCLWKSAPMAESTTGMFFAIQPSISATFSEVYLPYNLTPDTDFLGISFPDYYGIAYSKIMRIKF